MSKCNCGGIAGRNGVFTSDNINFCSLHDSAFEMLAALKAILAGNTMQKANSWSLAEVIQQHYKIARAAIVKATEGKE